MRASIRLAVSQINETGVLGRQVTVIERDEGTDSTSAQSALRQLIDEDQVDVVIGPGSARSASGLVNVVSQQSIPTCSPATTAIGLRAVADRGYYVRTVASDTLQAAALARLMGATGQRSAAVLSPNDDYGTDLGRSLRGWLASNSITVVSSQEYDPAVADAIPATVNRAVATKPGVFAVISSPTSGGQLLDALFASRVSSSEIFVSDGMRTADLYTKLTSAKPEMVEGIRGVSVAPNVQDRSVAWFASLWAQSPITRSLPISYTAYAYDCANLLALAVESAQSDNPAKVAEQLQAVSRGGRVCHEFAVCAELLRDANNIDLEGASGPLDLLPNGDVQAGYFDTFAFDATGRDTFVAETLISS